MNDFDDFDDFDGEWDLDGHDDIDGEWDDVDIEVCNAMFGPVEYPTEEELLDIYDCDDEEE